MNSLHSPEWLPSLLVPFFTLSYPVPAPVETDSFHDSSYYTTGPHDLLFVIGCIAVMAVLRDAARLGIMEPFARWKLRRDLAYTRSLRAKKLANGNGHTNGHANGHVNGNGNGHSNGHANGAANGHSNGDLDTSSERVLERKEDRDLHRKVLRFAEQAWSVIYYVATWSFGMVCLQVLLADMLLTSNFSMCISTSLLQSMTGRLCGRLTQIYPSLDLSNSTIFFKRPFIFTRS